LISIYFL